MKTFIFFNGYGRGEIIFITQANNIEELGWTIPLTEDSTYLVSIDGRIFRFVDEPHIIEVQGN